MQKEVKAGECRGNVPQNDCFCCFSNCLLYLRICNEMMCTFIKNIDVCKEMICLRKNMIHYFLY